MSKTLQALKKAWGSFRRWFGRRYQAEIVQNDLPETLEKYRVYIVEESSYMESAALLCPCGCGKILYLNLLEEERPCWRVRIATNGEASLSPSVWRKTGCKSHFWLRHGKVHWCP